MSLDIELRKIVLKEFEVRKKKNSSYSMRAFARDLNVSVATISRLISKKSNLSYATIKGISSKLPLSKSQKRKFDKAYYDPYKEVDINHRLAKPLLENWYYYAILSLLTLANAPKTPSAIARRLNITKNQSEQALSDLEELGLLIKDKNEQLKPSGKNLTFSGDITHRRPKIQPKNFQLGMLNKQKLAIKELSKENFNDSDISFAMMTVNKKDLPEAKKRIMKFRRSLAKFLEPPYSNNPDEVYSLSIGFFPLSKSS